MDTNRIILRPWCDSDAEVLYKWASDPDVGPRAGWAPHQSVEESLEIIRTVFNDALHTWAIELKETGEAIGAMGYGPSCECDLPAREGEPLIGYWVAKPYWNKGICTEALRLMLDHIRETTDIKSLISGHFVDNPASGRVMEKCGFVPTGETCIDEKQYQGMGRPIRVLRLVIKTNMDKMIGYCGINCENCTGCRGDGVKYFFCNELCEIKPCVTSKGYGSCAECAEIDSCTKLAAEIGNNEDARNNLKHLIKREQNK